MLTAVAAETVLFLNRRRGSTGSLARLSTATKVRRTAPLPANNAASSQETQSNVEPPRNRPIMNRARNPPRAEAPTQSLKALAPAFRDSRNVRYIIRKAKIGRASCRERV